MGHGCRRVADSHEQLWASGSGHKSGLVPVPVAVAVAVVVKQSNSFLCDGLIWPKVLLLGRDKKGPCTGAQRSNTVSGRERGSLCGRTDGGMDRLWLSRLSRCVAVCRVSGGEARLSAG